MHNRFENYNATALTPIHIGKGHVLTEYEYFIEDNICYLINLNKLSIIEDKFNGKYKIFESITKHINFKTKLSEDLKYIIKKQSIFYNIFDNDLKNNKVNKISLFTGSKSDLYIPGSSIKGAMLTAIINNELKKDPSFYDKKKFNTINNNKDFRQRHKTNIAVRDSKHLNPSDFILAKTYTPSSKGRDLSNLMIVFQTGKCFDIDLNVYDTKTISQFYESVLKLEKEKKAGNALNDYYHDLTELIKNLKDNKINFCLLRLGLGSGCYSTSAYLETSQNKHIYEKRIKGKRIDIDQNHTIPMGWLILTKANEKQNLYNNKSFKDFVKEWCFR